MTLNEYRTLEVGDVVYYVAVRFHEMIIEPRKVTEIFNCPWRHWRAVFVEGGILGRGQWLDRQIAFLNIDEASKCLLKLINGSKKSGEAVEKHTEETK